MIGVNVTFQYGDQFDRARVLAIAQNARGSFEGMPGLRCKFFTLDDKHHRATNFYVWDSQDTAESFFSDELRERVTGLYGIAPAIEFVEIAQIVNNSAPTTTDPFTNEQHFRGLRDAAALAASRAAPPTTGAG